LRELFSVLLGKIAEATRRGWRQGCSGCSDARKSFSCGKSRGFFRGKKRVENLDFGVRVVLLLSLCLRWNFLFLADVGGQIALPFAGESVLIPSEVAVAFHGRTHFADSSANVVDATIELVTEKSDARAREGEIGRICQFHETQKKPKE